MKTLCPDGVWGYPSKASAEKGRIFLEQMASRTAARIEDLRKELEGFAGFGSRG
jgi:creatinine amidohydrolase/Fe(II)-dependent formamide hydrolase-like protein